MMVSIHFVSLAGSSSSKATVTACEGSERSSKLIINNEMSSTSERIGAA